MQRADLVSLCFILRYILHWQYSHTAEWKAFTKRTNNQFHAIDKAVLRQLQ